MSEITSILAATDFSMNGNMAVRRAILLARENSARLELLNVVPEDVLSELRELFSSSIYTEQHILEDVRRRLDEVAADLHCGESFAIERHTRTGDVLPEILAAADHAELLVLGAHGSGTLRDLLIGTIAERLLRNARRPMLIVKQEPMSSYRRVMVPIDFSIHSIAALRFAQQIAPKADLLVFHAYECPSKSELIVARIPQENIEQYHADRRAQALSNMEGLRERSIVRRANTEFLVECCRPKTGVAATANEQEIELIVMGKQGRTFIGELVLGGVTRSTVARAHCDVTVVPDHPRL